MAELHRAEKLSPRSPDIITMFALVYGRIGQRAEVRRCQAELNAVAEHTYVSPGHYSAIAAGLGDMDTYFAWMEKSLEQGFPMIRGLKTDPIYDEVRKDARFESLLKRAGFVP